MLDFLRGLCLIDMMIVHLIIVIPQKYFESFVEMTNFAAEGFFLLSGVMAGLVYYQRYVKDAKGVSGRLIRKAYMMLGIHILTIIVFMVIYHVMGLLVIKDMSSLFAVLIRVASFEKVYHLTNILYIFFLLFLMTPGMLWISRKAGDNRLMIISSLIFMIGLFFPHHLFISYPAFPIIQWQFVYVLGFVLGKNHESVKKFRVSLRTNIVLLIGLAALFALRFQTFLRFTYHPLIYEEFFKKFPIHIGLAMYVGLLIYFGYLLVRKTWPSIKNRWCAKAVSRLGEYTLAAFLAHMYIDFFIHKAYEAGLIEGYARILVLQGEIILVYMIVITYDRVSGSWKKQRKIPANT